MVTAHYEHCYSTHNTPDFYPREKLLPLKWLWTAMYFDKVSTDREWQLILSSSCPESGLKIWHLNAENQPSNSNTGTEIWAFLSPIQYFNRPKLRDTSFSFLEFGSGSNVPTCNQNPLVFHLIVCHSLAWKSWGESTLYLFHNPSLTLAARSLPLFPWSAVMHGCHMRDQQCLGRGPAPCYEADPIAWNCVQQPTVFCARCSEGTLLETQGRNQAGAAARDLHPCRFECSAFALCLGEMLRMLWKRTHPSRLPLGPVLPALWCCSRISVPALCQGTRRRGRTDDLRSQTEPSQSRDDRSTWGSPVSASYWRTTSHRTANTPDNTETCCAAVLAASQAVDVHRKNRATTTSRAASDTILNRALNLLRAHPVTVVSTSTLRSLTFESVGYWLPFAKV